MDFLPLAAQYFDAGFRQALAISLLVGAAAFVVMRLYTRAVMRESQRSASSIEAARVAPERARSPVGDVAPPELHLETPGRNVSTGPRSATFKHAEQAFRRAAYCYVVAGLVHAAASTALLFVFGFYVPPRTSSALTLLACYAGVFWAWFFTTTVALALFYGPDRRVRAFLVAAYVAMLPLLGVLLELAGAPALPFAEVPMIAKDQGALMMSFAQAVAGKAATAESVSFSPHTQPTLFFALSAIPLVIPVLAFNRFVRGTVGPVFITFALLITLGPLAVMDLLIVTLRGFDLKAVFGESPSRILWPLSFAAAIVLATLLLLWLVRRYRTRKVSDQTFLFDALWLSVSVCVTVYLMGNELRLIYLLGLVPFALYKAVTAYGLRRFVASDKSLPNARLLFLRVFGSAKRSEKLFDLLAARWRYAGTVQLISGTDIARSRFEPDEFLDFIAGRFATRYITNIADVDQRLSQLESRPDPDGRYRVDEFFCRADAWQQAVTRLMQCSDLVAMDLRGFTAERRGCVFELGALIDSVPLDRVVLLFDRTTDVALLRQTLEGLWASMAPESPNRRTGTGRIRMIDLTGGYARAVRSLMQIGDELLLESDSGQRAPREHPELAPA